MWIEPLKKELIILDEKKVKNTARCPIQFVLMDAQNHKYLLVIGKTPIQKFYIRRSLEYQREWYKNFSEYNFRMNMPIYFWEENHEIKVLYSFFDGMIFVKDNKPIEYIDKIYKYKTKNILCTESNLDLILNSFMEAWPLEYHSKICNLSLFKKYRKKLSSYSSIKICLEHGDFTLNNIMMTQDKNIYLMDFEFAKKNQPIGMDKMDFKRTRDGKCIKTDYCELNRLKLELMEEINCMLDGVEYVKPKLIDKILGISR